MTVTDVTTPSIDVDALASDHWSADERRNVDVVAEFGYIEAGTAVRVTKVESFRIVVDRVSPDEQSTDQSDNPDQETT